MVKIEQTHRIGKDFVLAGDAVFTIECPADWVERVGGKSHYTYQVQAVESERYGTSFFVRMLTGPDNTADFTYIGRLDTFTGQVTPTKASGWNERTTPLPVRLLNRVLARVWTSDHDAYRRHGFKLHHEGKCGRCGRRLTVPASVESGIGPECVKMLKTY